MATRAFAVEVITLPVNNVDRKVRFDGDKFGFALWPGRFAPGLDPARGNYASFADPDGNTWIIEKRGFRQTSTRG
jgi:hypothetical protein